MSDFKKGEIVKCISSIGGDKNKFGVIVGPRPNGFDWIVDFGDHTDFFFSGCL